jgi:hypothetical protein
VSLAVALAAIVAAAIAGVSFAGSQSSGYQPAYDTDRAVADYLAWLRAGHER